jgi:predicted phosphodiesterase
MYALISDIHGNLEALRAVLADIDARGVETIYCLGDVVGYGPEPLACVDLIMERTAATVRGNHEEALFSGAYGFHLRAQEAIEWTREQLQPGFFSGLAVKRRWSWLTSLPRTYAVGPDLLVHGSPRDPVSEYLMAQDLPYYPEKYAEVFELTGRIVFAGHSHLPVLITDQHEAFTPEELGGRWSFPERCEAKALVNVGSVGQPRDGNPEACYVVVSEDAAGRPTVEWRRVPYDHRLTKAKIDQVDRLHETLGQRLALGR